MTPLCGVSKNQPKIFAPPLNQILDPPLHRTRYLDYLGIAECSGAHLHLAFSFTFVLQCISLIPFTPYDGRYRQTSKEIIANANARYERASCSITHSTTGFEFGLHNVIQAHSFRSYVDKTHPSNVVTYSKMY